MLDKDEKHPKEKDHATDPFDMEHVEPLMKSDPLVGNAPIDDAEPVVNPFPPNLDPSHYNPVINPGAVIDDEPENPDEMIRRD